MIQEKTTEVIENIHSRNPKVDTTMGLDEEEGLQRLIEDSQILYNPERAKKFLELAKQSKWVGVAPELSYLMRNSQGEKPQNPYILGLTNIMNATDAYSIMLDGDVWNDSYTKLGIDPHKAGHTELFMNAITSGGTDIVFFVPSLLYSHPGSNGVTKDEMEWLMNHPDRASNTYLVFGGYKFISEKYFRANSLTNHKEVSAEKLSEAFLQWAEDIFK